MSLKKREYHAQRAEVELKLGDLAADARVAAVHYEMALRYSILAGQEGGKRRAMKLVEGDLKNVIALRTPQSIETPTPWDEQRAEGSAQHN